VSTPAELRIATRIHFGLKHMLGEGIDVETMLKQPQEAREILFVCQASGNPELMALAKEFAKARSDKPRAAQRPAAPVAAAAPKTRGAAKQDLAWARDTSGFGITQPAELSPAEDTTTSWRKPSTWLRTARP